MNKLELTLACEQYDRTDALREGKIEPEGINLIYLPLSPQETFWRMIRHMDFDVAEMSLAAYIIARSRGETRIIAIPVFPSREFRHSAIYINVNSRIAKPEDLKGKRVGVPEYQLTAVVWARGILQKDYGVDPRDICWLTGGQEQPGREERIELKKPAGVSIEPIPKGCSLSSMLDEGELDAIITPLLPSVFARRSPRVRRLFENFREVEKDFYKRTGVFPIMHTLVMKTSLYERYPWVSQSIYKAFCKSRDEAVSKLYDTNALRITLPWVVAEVEEEEAMFLGQDIWPYGVEPNRKTIQTLIEYLKQQQLLERDLTIEELFAPNTFDTYKT
ncbi:MAG: PhnD/SsuA/transferrin family substrate-binding protein [Candidatus Binatia bacterium]